MASPLSRMSALHLAQILPYIRDGLFDNLKDRLKNYVIVVDGIPTSQDEELMYFDMAMQRRLIARWFVKDPSDPDNIQMWIPNLALREYHQELRHGSINNLIIEFSADIFKKAELRRKKLEGDKEVFEKADAGADEIIRKSQSSAKREVRSVSLAEYPAERENYERQKEDWDQLVKEMYKFKEATREYREDGGVQALMECEAGKYLDDEDEEEEEEESDEGYQEK